MIGNLVGYQKEKTLNEIFFRIEKSIMSYKKLFYTKTSLIVVNKLEIKKATIYIVAFYIIIKKRIF